MAMAMGIVVAAATRCTIGDVKRTIITAGSMHNHNTVDVDVDVDHCCKSADIMDNDSRGR